MNSWLHKWLERLGTAYPSASSSYWRAMPLGRMKKLLAAAFFTVSALGFVLDLLLLNHPHLGRGLVWPLLLGALAAGTLAARVKGTHLYPLIWLIFGGDMGNSRKYLVPVGILIAFVGAIRLVSARTTAASADVYDVVILGGRVIDPESGLDGVRNVGISGQTIKVITSELITGETTIDAKGLVVAPGFIDLHQHDNEPSDYALNVMDGVTSALELETGTADVDAWYDKRAGKALINFGVSAGHLPARVAVMGDPRGDYPSGDAAHRSATEKEIADIKALLVRGLERGAVAVGTKPGLTPGASNWEMLEVFRVAAQFRAPVVDHQRDTRTDKATLETRGLLGVEEAIAASAITGAPLHIAHVFSPRVFEMIAEAQAKGMDVTTECYPYTSGAIPLQSAIFDPGWQERLGIEYKDLIWAETGERLTEESFARYRKISTTKRVIYTSLTENAVTVAIANPLTMIISDGNRYHPREAGTYSRVLGKYVREEKALTLMEALRKMTVMPARRLEQRAPMMKKKGRITAGADADITIFDPDHIIDRATIEEPARPSEGVRYVLINGVLVVKERRLQDGVLPGKPIRAEIH